MQFLMELKIHLIMRMIFLKPNNIYSGSKYLSEVFVESICKKHYIIRFPTLFGDRKNNLLVLLIR